MVSSERLAQWERVRDALAMAWSRLPAATESGDGLALYSEFLDANELGLAMETLAEVGAARGAEATFWDWLAGAADEMERHSDAAEYRSRAQQVAERDQS